MSDKKNTTTTYMDGVSGVTTANLSNQLNKGFSGVSTANTVNIQGGVSGVTTTNTGSSTKPDKSGSDKK